MSAHAVPQALLTFAPWAVGTLVAASATIAGNTSGPRWLYRFGKPLMMPLLVMGTVFSPSTLSENAHGLLLAALALSWVGDVALMGDKRGFVVGLVAFLFAHVAYLACFSLEHRWSVSQWPFLVPVLVIAIAGSFGLWRHLGSLLPAVAAYVVALSLVAWRLFARFELLDAIGLLAVGLGVVGALFFVTGDTLLAWRRFAHVRPPYWLELGAYAVAQVCIVGGTLVLRTV